MFCVVVDVALKHQCREQLYDEKAHLRHHGGKIQSYPIISANIIFSLLLTMQLPGWSYIYYVFISLSYCIILRFLRGNFTVPLSLINSLIIFSFDFPVSQVLHLPFQWHIFTNPTLLVFSLLLFLVLPQSFNCFISHYLSAAYYYLTKVV